MCSSIDIAEARIECGTQESDQSLLTYAPRRGECGRCLESTAVWVVAARCLVSRRAWLNPL